MLYRGASNLRQAVLSFTEEPAILDRQFYSKLYRGASNLRQAVLSFTEEPEILDRQF